MCMCVWGGVGGVGGLILCSFLPLCLELQAKADLVAASVDVLAVKESRQSQLDSCRNTHTHTHVRIRTAVTSSPRFSTHSRSLTTGVQLTATELAHLA